jgi:iron complex outermembrane recepter protein
MKRNVIAAILAGSAPAVWAPAVRAQTPPPSTIVVTGSLLGASEVAAPTSVLTGDALVLRRGSSLGETLAGLPGVSSTYFGPNTNRPVIRGQDGDRIRVLSNSSASVDASSLSFDHAVPIDPLVIERIEVLRGPAALMYGGNAVGGVVNAIDNRIPKARIDGVLGSVETRLGGAAAERALSGLVEAGGGGFALHADGFKRSTSDLRVPTFARPLADGSSERRNRVVNSASQAQGGALGGSWVNDSGYLGLSVDTYRNNYGIVAEDDVGIRMRRDKWALAGERRWQNSFVTTLRVQGGYTKYQHEEVSDDGVVGTTFKSQGSDLRLEANHAALALAGGQLDGVLGLQAEDLDFSALGAEAFVPTTHTQHGAAFVVERWRWGSAERGGQLSAGVRAEQVRESSSGDGPGTAPRFGQAQSRRFTPGSASLGLVLNMARNWQLSSSIASTARAPTSYELYADGVHAATAAYERGDVQQRQELGRNVDLGVAWQQGHCSLKLSVFDSRFNNYIALDATGEPDFVDDTGRSFRVYAFRGVRARLSGYELEGHWRVWDAAQRLTLEFKLDSVKGRKQDNGQALPRLSPQRLGIGAHFSQGDWGASLDVQHSAAQTQVPTTDMATAGYTLINLSASYNLKLGNSNALLFAKLQNAGNVLAYSAGSAPTVRALAPLPGRGFAAGLRWAF